MILSDNLIIFHDIWNGGLVQKKRWMCFKPWLMLGTIHDNSWKKMRWGQEKPKVLCKYIQIKFQVETLNKEKLFWKLYLDSLMKLSFLAQRLFVTFYYNRVKFSCDCQLKQQRKLFPRKQEMAERKLCYGSFAKERHILCREWGKGQILFFFF